MQTDIEKFISEKITTAFDELARQLSDELAAKYGEEMPTGALAFEMMAAEMNLQARWREYCEKKAKETA